MRTVTLMIATLLVAGGVAQAKGQKGCAAQWSAAHKSGARSSQTRAQFMTTCEAAGAPGGAPKPISQSVAPRGGR